MGGGANAALVPARIRADLCDLDHNPGVIGSIQAIIAIAPIGVLNVPSRSCTRATREDANGASAHVYFQYCTEDAIRWRA
jgi:hypothetical protein